MISFSLIKGDVFGKHVSFCLLIGITAMSQLQTKLDYRNVFIVMRSSVSYS